MLKEKSRPKGGYLKYIGILLLLLGLSILIFTYYPAIRAYIDYKLLPPPKETAVQIVNEGEQITKEINKNTEIVFVDNDFGLYIPKIKANAKVIKNVDPYNEDIYINALIYGVAHAKGTPTPNSNGNVFLFAHSAVNFYERRKYNVYFYLLRELEKDDEIYVSYEGEIYRYTVFENKIVEPSEIKYLGTYLEEDTLTLMTCWPMGVDSKRAIVIAKREE